MDEKMSSGHFLEGKTIIVAGAGVAGSAFVLGLRQCWNPAWKPPTIHIYEGDSPDGTARREGYSLSLAGHDASGGLVALKKLGLLEETLDKAVSGVDGLGAFKIWGPDWTERASFRREPVDDLPTSSIRITRKDLRSILHEAQGPDDSIKWGARCVSAKRLEDGRMRVMVIRGPAEMENITEVDCDLLIAADGARSYLRACLRPDDKLEFAGAVLRGGIARFDGPLPKPVEKDWGFMVSGTGVSCFFSPVDKRSIVWGVGHLEDTQVPRLDLNSSDDVQSVIARALELGSGLQEPFKTIVAHTDPRTVLCLNARDKKPFAHDSTPVIFIGDSNHAVSPFAGYGANLALADAWDLAEKLCGEKRMLGDAVAAYDEGAVPRAMKILEGSRARLKEGHRTEVKG